MSATDLDLLQQYVRDHADDAFTELVNRHVDLIYSAALRQVRSPQLAEEVAQSVFTDLSRNASGLKPDTILTAWLYQVTRRTAVDVIRRESRRQMRENIAAEIAHMNSPSLEWTRMEPLLDEAMDSLEATDRAALLLRYFENRSLREVGETLGTSEDAAQKRVSRAVERLRDFFARRGVAVGAGGFAAILSANAVHAAPAGLGVTISAATLLAGTAAPGAATLGTVKAVATMVPAIQKTLFAAAVAASAGWGIYEANQVAGLKQEVRALEKRQTLDTGLAADWRRRNEEAAHALADLREENDRLRHDQPEVSRLHNEIARLQPDSAELARMKTANARKDAAEAANRLENPPPFTYGFLSAYPDPAKEGIVPPKPDELLPVPEALVAKTNRLGQWLAQSGKQNSPELDFVGQADWLQAVKKANLDTEAGARRAIADLQESGRWRIASQILSAMRKFIVEHEGELPASLAQLQPYFSRPVPESWSGRYQFPHSGKLADVPENARGDLAVETGVGLDKPAKLLQIGLHNVTIAPRK